MSFIEFLTPEHAQIAIGASFDEWDTYKFSDYNSTSGKYFFEESPQSRRVLSGFESKNVSEDVQVRDLYSAPLAKYWQDMDMYGDTKPIPDSWLRLWENVEWGGSACEGLYFKDYEFN